MKERDPNIIDSKEWACPTQPQRQPPDLSFVSKPPGHCQMSPHVDKAWDRRLGKPTIPPFAREDA